MTKGTESGCKVRAAIVDTTGKLDMKEWEERAAKHMGHVWFTDCDSLYEHLVSPKMNSVDNKKIAIDLMSLRQQVWERAGERTQIVDHSCGDYPRWIDTSTMIADPLTKVMSAERLMRAMMIGKFDMEPTAESLMIKERNRQCRKTTRSKKKGKQSQEEKATTSSSRRKGG